MPHALSTSLKGNDLAMAISTRAAEAVQPPKHRVVTSSVLAEPVSNANEAEIPTAPADDEVYEYLGPQMRWVQLFLIAAFLLAAWSLLQFSMSRIVLWPMLIVLGLNVIGTILSALTSFSKRRVSWRGHQKLVSEWMPEDGIAPSIDVFLPTYGEDLDVLRNTYFHVAQLIWDGPVTPYVLDDGDRSEVQALAEEFGFEYVVRPNRGHLKKAGNLQHALSISHGDHIVILDADFCPRHDFLEHLVPYMDDDAVGIVQSPQCFSTTEEMSWIQRTAGSTQELFYRWILPSRDRSDAAICVGTCALYRREALSRVGGFAQIEHSEDIHTGLHLLQAGYITRYVPVVVSRGLCPSDLAGFLNQQYRWCMGSLVRLDNEHLADAARSMSWRQRLAFWAGVLYYVTTALNVFVLFVPGIIMAAFFPHDVEPRQFVPFLVGLWVYMVLLPLVSRSRWRFEVLRIQMAYSYAHAMAIWHKMVGREAGWVATGAVGSSNSLAKSISRLGVVALGGSLALFWALTIYDIHKFGFHQFWLMAMFVGIYSYLAIPLLIEFGKILSTRSRNKLPGLPSSEPLPVGEKADQ